MLDINRFIEKAGTEIPDRIVRKVVIDMGTRVVYRTPVGDPKLWAPTTPVPPGYVGGTLRAGWHYSHGATLSRQPVGPDDDGAATIAAIMAAIPANPAGKVHFLQNNVPYGEVIEFQGHSRQAPAGMVRVTVLEFEQIVGGAVLQVSQ